MKIGILTFHDVFNPGAFLQALGTQTLLRNLGHDAWVIDYTSPSHRFKAIRYLLKWRWRSAYLFPSLIRMIYKDRAFETARNELLNRTRFFETREDIYGEQFDVVLIGADVVWNFKHAVLGRDPVYFGNGLNTDRLVSFAASFGDCSESDGVPGYVREGLSCFDFYSVRDANTKSLVQNLTGCDALQICDPAFHLDVDSVLAEQPHREPYLLVYLRNGVISPELKAEVRAFAKSRGLRLVATYYTHWWADENLYEIKPQDWLALIRGAEYVVTNTFHGSVFSIILEKQFALDYNEGIRLKTEGMINKMGLTDRVIDDAANLGDILDRPIDYAIARQFREHETSTARDFLCKALS